MANAPTRTEPSAPTAPPACVLEDPAATPDGIRHGRRGGSLLPWSAVHTAIAAEVGEPEGVRTIVFDLVVEQAGERRILRLDAEPGDAAMQVARSIARGVAGGRKLPAVESLAADGTPAHWYPDLETFEAARDELLGLPKRDDVG